MQEVTDLFSFFGKFHPLFVHLPIGFLILAILLEIFKLWKPDHAYSSSLPFIWLFAILAAILSVLSGLTLAETGAYDNALLTRHKTGGILLVVFTTVCYMLSVQRVFKSFRTVRTIKNIFIVLVIMLLIFTGHWGGSLTHGEDYLVSASSSDMSLPAGLKVKIESLDSVDIFKDAVMPIIQAKCVSCHNKDKKKGGLLLTSYESILNGGKTRTGVVPGNIATSEIFRRITLPRSHKEFMPSDGKTPLTELQLNILEYWIETGAHPKMMIADLQPNQKMQDVFNDFFQIGRDPILSYAATKANPEHIVALIKEGFQVFAINNNSNLLEIKYNKTRHPPELSLLLPVKEQLVWLHLPACGITDEGLATIAQLKNLFKLNLNRNQISDKGTRELLTLTRLEYLNLYGTSITETGINALTELPALKKLYVWDTKADSSFLEKLSKAKNKIEIVFQSDAK